MPIKPRRKSQRAPARVEADPSLEEIQMMLLDHILTSALALHMIKNSKKPMAKGIKDLIDVEIAASKIVTMIMQARAKSLKRFGRRNILAGAYSFLQFTGQKVDHKKRG
jgi:hypothetical protein